MATGDGLDGSRWTSTPSDMTWQDVDPGPPPAINGAASRGPASSTDDINLTCNGACSTLRSQATCLRSSTPVGSESQGGDVTLTCKGLNQDIPQPDPKGDFLQEDHAAVCQKDEPGITEQSVLPADEECKAKMERSVIEAVGTCTCKMECSEFSDREFTCLNDEDENFEEVILVEEPSQERTKGPRPACCQSSDTNLKRPEITSLSEDNVHVRLKDRAWETPPKQSDRKHASSFENSEYNSESLVATANADVKQTGTNRCSACSETAAQKNQLSLNVCNNSDKDEDCKAVNREGESLPDESPPFRFFDELPRELFFKILTYFSIWELCLTISPVCKDWYDFSKSPVLWQRLDLSECRDIGHIHLCAVLGRVPLLKLLSLRGRERLCIGELQLLKGCPLLTSLNLGFCDNVNGRVLDEIVRCCLHLEVLNLEGCEGIDDDVAARFPSLPCLKVLNLSHCTKMTDDGVMLISRGCLGLQELNVDGIPWITDRAVKTLASERLQTLRAVFLDGAELTDRSVGYLIDCPLLSTLSLSFCEQMTDKALSMLQTVDHLKHLRLKRGLEFTEESLCNFFECGRVGHLTFLDLSECSELMDRGVTSIARRCPELRKLALCWCWNISDVGIEEIIQHCSQLRYLDIVGLDKVRGHCLAKIPEALPSLVLLDLRQCNLINDKMLVDLVKIKPDLYIFNYYGEEVTTDMIL